MLLHRHTESGLTFSVSEAAVTKFGYGHLPYSPDPAPSNYRPSPNLTELSPMEKDFLQARLWFSDLWRLNNLFPRGRTKSRAFMRKMI